jgi:type I restriction enzyme S subunit
MAENKLPSHWHVKKLGEVCNVLDNLRKPINSAERQKRINSKSEKDLFPYYGATGQVGWIDSFITDNEYILVGEDGAPFLDLFKDKAYKIKGKTWVNNHAHILEGKKNTILNDFALHYLNSINYRKYVNGTTRLKLTKTNLIDILFVVPPISEQQAIVSKIEELLSDLENGKQQLQIAQQQLKVYRQSLLKWAFEGKLTNSDLNGKLPKGWKKVKTGEIIGVINNGYTPTKEYLSDGIGEIPFIKVYNLNFDGTLNFNKNPTFIPSSIHKTKLKRSICFPNDVLINIVGPPLGKVSIVSDQYPEWNINQAIVLFRPNERIISKYIAFFLQNPSTIRWLEDTSKATAGQWNVKVSTCRLIPIPIPPIEEQRYIVDELESKLTVCDKIEEIISQGLQQSEMLRQSILKKAFEGRLI